ncbi:hypothetical protein [Flagellimonas meridianipacifica]|uniref:Uncharacterized protein n=1 Tax=Flagellimonas meridianipacifica TaxID=1080225 RepID=A0A2T0MGM1_9FLAO|nr:hypothetical protein [Allomuricauda pacifica]PRX56676.1 hypothetical protein CLV81_0673 [Allomuricauda pacifica]
MSFLDALNDHAEEIESYGLDFRLNPGDAPRAVQFIRPSVSYDLLQKNYEPNICHTSNDFIKEDFHDYFDVLKDVCSKSLGELMNEHSNVDFEIYSSPNRNLKAVYAKAMGKKNIYQSEMPSFGRIGLYNSLDENGKAPRIFFALGHWARLHVLIFDPLHQIYPSNNN